MRLTSTWTVLLAAFLLCLAGCSDGESSKCGTCPAGTKCNEATGVCEALAQCPAGGCGANASCRDNKICACLEGFSDCNQDLSTGGDGCECSEKCDGNSCGTGVCDPATFQSCGFVSSYCDGGTCKPCAGNTLNCDGINDCETDGSCISGTNCSPTQKDSCNNSSDYCKDGNCLKCPVGKFNCDGINDCESSEACGCDPATKDSCTGDGQYCNAGTCTPCPSGKYNCDGIADCESSTTCAGPGGCVKECTDFDEYLCVKDPANNNRCEECLIDADCTKNPRSKGVKCDTSDLAGTGYNFCVCAGAGDCANSTMGKLCKAVAGANPKLTQCTCDADTDCPATHPICEGSLFKRCEARCIADTDCIKGGVQGTCDTGTGECSYPSYP